ncbi:MAG: Bug family tripartite tricarboxylate transporter substrate binding protein, partial [Burkholderiales bacterium]
SIAPSLLLPQIKAGKLRALVSGATSRYLPSVPTFMDEGYDFRASFEWFGLFMAAATPRPIVNRLNGETRKIISSPVFQEKVLTPQFYEAAPSSAEEFAAFLAEQRKELAELVRISGIKPVDL